ncbi:MAG: 4-alpha-glucanotransferase [Gammaproteobacteria bacterium]|nr:4-alpha-glucanotransferase [Gammaproteobacteria bacterium]
MRGDVLDRRRAGILLHPTSLPSGVLGPDAFRFVDFMLASGLSVWQTLPLGPTHDDGSPYQCLSVHAGNTRLISLELLAEQGWLSPEAALADNADMAIYRRAQLEEARRGFAQYASAEEHAEFAAFALSQAHWLDDFALYQALRHEQGGYSWVDWPVPLRDRAAHALRDARKRLADAIEQACFEQFLFFRQWQSLKRHANARGILLFGDMPIFVAHDSADVWAHRDHFLLDEQGRAQVVAGVPPDYFSATGQRWGNPHYQWQRMQDDGFRWWTERMVTQLALFDMVRVDHFRGFEAYWEIPAQSHTAVDGRWIKAPGDELFSTLRKTFDPLPLVAEDLGIITPEVEALRKKYRLPGMKILQFAFEGGPGNPYLSHNHMPNGVVYTGTHDNNTTAGWFEDLPHAAQEHVLEYLGHPQEPMPWPLMRCAFASVARLAVIPMQDALALDGEHRMNLPGTTEGNWRWRFSWEQIPDDLSSCLRRMVEMYGRVGVALL